MLEKLKTVSEQATSEKEAREKWIERYETEYKAHLQTTEEVMKLRTEVKALEHKCKDQAIELESLTKLSGRLRDELEDKTYNLNKTLMELEATQRELEATKGMLQMVETQHNEYVTRLRNENKKLIAKQELETRLLEMRYEDVRSL